MGELTGLESFPSFADVRSNLTKKQFRCIWYLPNKLRYCLLRIEASDIKFLLELVSQLDDRPLCTLKILSKIAELSCCARHHRNKIWGSGIGQRLAHKWQEELQSDLCRTGFVSAPAVEVECEHSPRCGVAEVKEETEKKVELVAFAPHIPFERDTLRSTLLSWIEPSARITGSVYAFTHQDSAFDGMIKIGYTRRPIGVRVQEWTECGHGPPSLRFSLDEVRYPERVEKLIHFQLVDDWHAMRWCKHHEHPHIEWFKSSDKIVSQVAKAWKSWIDRANPYDRRGYLKPYWQDILDFLAEYEIIVTAELMVQIQEIEEGTISVASFIEEDLPHQERSDLGCAFIKQEGK